MPQKCLIIIIINQDFDSTMSLTGIASQCVALNDITVGNDYFMTLSRGAVFKSPGMRVGDGI